VLKNGFRITHHYCISIDVENLAELNQVEDMQLGILACFPTTVADIWLPYIWYLLNHHIWQFFKKKLGCFCDVWGY